MKVPYVIYADFEALVRKIHRCERNPEIKASYTEKTEQHEACGYSYMVVRSFVAKSLQGRKCGGNGSK